MSIYDRLNEQQQKAVFTTEGPVLLLAGAGSGKTGVITHRIAYLIDELGVNSYNILAITFTNKAAKEMKERVDNLVGFGADAAWIMTFHSCCVRILRRYIDRLGYELNFTIYDTDDQKSVMKDVCKRMNLDPKVYKEKAILSRISSAKDQLMSPDKMYQTANNDYNKMRIAEAYRLYQEQLQKNNAVDFDDIICLTVRLFEENPDILRYYQDRFKYVMVDEYQDTNTAQFRFIQLIAGGYNNLCVVGDDDQSIYKFRGANIYNILNFEEYYTEAAVIKLEQNYRSSQNILDAANSVIANNTGRKSKHLWTDAGEGEKIRFDLYENGFLEAEGIAIDIENRTGDGYNYNDCAILYRTNAQSRSIEEKLIEHNIPYRIYGGINFYSRKEIKDILAYLKTIDNGKDDLAVKRILNVPKRGIGAVSMDKIQNYAFAKDISFFDALCRGEEVPGLGKTAAKIAPFTAMIRNFRSKAPVTSIPTLIRQIVEETGYFDFLADSDDEEQLEERKQNIDELISKAVVYEQHEDEPTLAGFLEEVALVADIDNLDEEKNIVSLMTMHSAKGLEFPIVYLAGMEDGLFPSYMSISSDSDEELEEERRLCYVGITRAKEKLIMSAAKVRMVRGDMQMNRVSRFVNEIPKKYIQSSDRTLNRSSMYATRTTQDFMAAPRQRGQIAFKSFQKDAIDKGIFNKGAPVTEGSLDYGVGDTVKHIKFGIGVVKEIKDGGRDFEVTVEFENSGIKKMFAAFAKLTKIS